MAQSEGKAPNRTAKSGHLTGRLKRKDVFKIIEDNGGPEGVNLADRDLSRIDLHWRSIRRRIGKSRTSQPVWYSSTTHGINLKGADLQNANLSEAVLVQADLSEAALVDVNLKSADCHDSRFTDAFLVNLYAPRTNFAYCDMRGCYLIRAVLHNTNLSNVRLQGADLSGAELNGAILCNAKLTEVDLSGAKLEGVNLYGAWLAGTYLTRQQIGDRVVQESEAYEHPNYAHSDQETGSEPIPGRYAQAASIYRALKNNFLSIGSYDDASWAYVKERKMRKQTHWPPRVLESYPLEYGRLPATSLNGKWCRLKFYGKHLVSFILDWVFELTSSYGERPSLALYWAVALVVGFALLFWGIGGITGAQTWLDYLNYSLGAFVTMNFDGLSAASRPAMICTSFEALLGICTLALLMFALGNRINRS